MGARFIAVWRRPRLKVQTALNLTQAPRQTTTIYITKTFSVCLIEFTIAINNSSRKRRRNGIKFEENRQPKIRTSFKGAFLW
jgi:hypothetical protein